MDFIYYNYGYFSSKTKDEVYRVLNRYIVNSLRKDAISKYYEQNKRKSALSL